MTTKEYNALMSARGKPVAAPAEKQTRAFADRYENKWERSFAAHLDILLAAKVIKSWRYASMKFLICDGEEEHWYKPDFDVVYPDDQLELIEVKGFWREAAKLRFDIARATYPHFYWRTVRPDKGQWITIRGASAGKEQP